MRSPRRVLAGLLLAAIALLLPMAGTAAAVSLSDCVGGGGSMAVGNGYFWCRGGDFHGEIIN